MRRVVILGSLLLLTACAGTNFKWENVNRLKPGMSKARVTKIMGEPYMRTVNPNGEVWVWSHSQAFGETKAVSVVFKNDTLSEVPSTVNMK